MTLYETEEKSKNVIKSGLLACWKNLVSSQSQLMIIGMSEGKNKSEQQNRNYYKEYVVEDERILENVPVHAKVISDDIIAGYISNNLIYESKKSEENN